ncbi:MAG: hypothetical protein NVSMB58_34590 [Terriglobales bacterium]
MKASSSDIVRFGVFQINSKTGELYKGAIKVRIQQQPLRILLILIQNAGEVVTREELRRLVWPDDTFVGFDDGLNAAVNKLRIALGDSAENHRFIETLPRRGYRFIAPVERPLALPATQSQEPQLKPTPQISRLPVRLGLALIVLGVIALGAAAGFRVRHRSSLPVSTPKMKVMLAVLPFENLTGDSAQEYFSDGLTEEMITQLGGLNPDRLGIIGRTSIMTYRHSTKRLDQIGRELGVSYVLEGSVRRTKDRMRVSAQLIRVQDQTHIWAATYDRNFSDVLTVQDEVAQRIADQIQLRLTPEEQVRFVSRRTANPDAYDDYLKGRYFWNKRSADGFSKAITYFRRATEEDPNYGAAYSGLASTYVLLEQYGIRPSDAVIPLASNAVRRAIQLDGNFAEAHAVLATIMMDSEWNWAVAEAEYKQAIELNPNDPSTRQWYSEYLAAIGQSDKAWEEVIRAQKLDPVSPIVTVVAGEISYFARHYDSTIAECRKALDLDPGFAAAHSFLGLAYDQQAHYTEAETELRKAIVLSDGSPKSTSFLGRVYALSNQTTKAKDVTGQLRSLATKRYVSPFDIALIYSALGDKQKAFEALEKAFIARDHWVVYCKVDPRLDLLRSDPRFLQLLNRFHLT